MFSERGREAERRIGKKPGVVLVEIIEDPFEADGL